ncbi:MAG: hypothetical protein JNJ86_10165 [Chitinophagaceae bacterium]|jgi:hypothetical protein|nr:hypothetical protein [Chitinophagaceae bacterium]
MGNNKKPANKSRRDFLSLFISADKKTVPAEMVKMLTADGKLVEVDKTVLDELTKKQKATNQQIFDWMKNPSKENS